VPQKAYSYQRFSSPGQLEGDSLRRQTEAARSYAARHDLELADLTFRDLGVSAFRGTNATEGALAAFSEAVDNGTVEPGSFLLVESLDRLSRDRIRPALNRFSDLLDKGVNIVTLSDSKVYTADSLDNLPDLILSLLVMSRAHEESALKSRRGRAVWKQKKKRAADGDLVTSSVPAWLRVRGGKIEVVQRKARVVKRIFELAAAGWGLAKIARTFNTEGVTVFGRGNGWSQSYVKLILRNAATIGRYQPHRLVYKDGKSQRIPDGDPVEGYYPAVIEPSLFYQVQQARPGPSGRGSHPPRNVLSRLVFCARCGGRMHFINKGRRHQYLDCDNRRRFRNCDARAVPYWPLLDSVLASVKEFRDIGHDDSAAKERDREVDAMAGQIEETQESIARLLDTLERVTSESVEQRLEELEAKKEELEVTRKELKDQQITRGDYIPPGTVYETFLNTTPRILPGPNSDHDLIAHIGAELRRQIERIEIERGQPPKVIPKG